MAVYLIRSFDDGLWMKFKKRAKAEGRTARVVVLALLARYANGEIGFEDTSATKKRARRS